MKMLFKNWDTMRIIRLLAGVAIGVYSVAVKDYIFLFLSGFLLLQALMNISCCGAQGCYDSKAKMIKKGIYEDQVKKLEL